MRSLNRTSRVQFTKARRSAQSVLIPKSRELSRVERAASSGSALKKSSTPLRKRSSYPNTFCERSRTGWRATKRCPGKASESGAPGFSLAGAGFTFLLSARRERNFRRRDARRSSRVRTKGVANRHVSCWRVGYLVEEAEFVPKPEVVTSGSEKEEWARFQFMGAGAGVWLYRLRRHTAALGQLCQEEVREVQNLR